MGFCQPASEVIFSLGYIIVFFISGNFTTGTLCQLQCRREYLVLSAIALTKTNLPKLLDFQLSRLNSYIVTYLFMARWPLHLTSPLNQDSPGMHTPITKIQVAYLPMLPRAAAMTTTQTMMAARKRTSRTIANDRPAKELKQHINCNGMRILMILFIILKT